MSFIIFALVVWSLLGLLKSIIMDSTTDIPIYKILIAGPIIWLFCLLLLISASRKKDRRQINTEHWHPEDYEERY